MEDNDKEETTSVRGIDWEVVSLTASTYAAAPGPKQFDPPIEGKTELNKDEHVASTALFLSNHFIFSPNEHKNHLMELDCTEVQKELGSKGAYLSEEEHSETIKYDEDNWMLRSDDALHGIQFFGEGRNLPDRVMEFGEGKQLEGLTMVGQEQDIYEDPCFSAFGAKTVISQSVFCNENAATYDQSLHSPDYLSDESKPCEENKFDESSIPCEAWWKRPAMCMYNHAKEPITFWSVFAAAAVVSFVLLGKRWHNEKPELQQLKWLTIGDESLSQTLGPVSRLKDILVGGRQPTLMIRNGATYNHLGI